MKTYMPLDGFRWSCDSDSALCDIPQTNVLGQAGGRCGAVASALLRQSRYTAEALSEMFLVVPCALSEGRAHSLGLLLYSQHCHR